MATAATPAEVTPERRDALLRTPERRRERAPSQGKDRCGAHEREADRGAGLTRQSGGVAG